MSVNGHHRNKKALTSALLAAVIFAGGYYIYDQGIIPGIGNGKKSVAELQNKIEAFEGKNIEAAVYEMFGGSSVISRLPETGKTSFNKSLKEMLDKDVDLVFTYSALEAHSNGVKVVNPKLAVISAVNSEKNYDITLPALYISQDDKDGGHYFYRAEGDVDFLSDTAKTGEKSKTFSLQHGKLEAEMKFSGGHTQLQKIHASDLKLVEGRSGTLLISIAAIDSETVQKHDDGKRVVQTKATYSRIEPGEMIKLFIGKLEPVDVKLDYVIEEDAENTDKKALSGEMKINDLSIKMGNAGMESNAELKYNPADDKVQPQGEMYVKFVQYHKVLTVLQKYYPVRPQDMRSVANFLMEVGADEGEDASFDLEFGGAKKVLINGKTEAEFDAVLHKYFPKDEPKPVESIPVIEKKKL